VPLCLGALVVRFFGYNWLNTCLLFGGLFMAITVEATYENGVLKPVKPLPLKEHEKVEITIKPSSSWVQETYGILGWKGSAQDADRFALDAELDFPPPVEGP
jgi:predicted DNA-binding antitoxin AbrB/MazE fold protein